MMIKKITLTLKSQSGEAPNIFWSYNLYGALMQKISPDYAEYLHNQGLKPVSQYLVPQQLKDETKAQWHIHLLGQEAVDNILPVVQNLSEINVANHNTCLMVESILAEGTITENEFVQKYLVENDGFSKIILRHISPCSFKTNNQYALFPSTEHIIKSAVQKWNAYAVNTIIDDSDAVNQLIGQSVINRYALRSEKYYIKGAAIPSFSGYEVLSIRGPLPLVRLFNLLMFFLEFSGVGIKTTLGMGGCVVAPFISKLYNR
jgi:CRISPR-associated endoribonuclease Cas6